MSVSRPSRFRRIIIVVICTNYSSELPILQRTRFVYDTVNAGKYSHGVQIQHKQRGGYYCPGVEDRQHADGRGIREKHRVSHWVSWLRDLPDDDFSPG